MFNCAYCKNIAKFECSKDRFCIEHTEFHKDTHRTYMHNIREIYCQLNGRQKKKLNIEMNNRFELLRNCKKEISESAAIIIRKVNLAVMECIKEIDIITQSYLSLITGEEFDEDTIRKIENILGSRLLKTKVKPYDDSSIKDYYSQKWFESLNQLTQWSSFIENNICECLSIKLSYDEEHMITGHLDNAARIWNVSTGEIEGCLIGHVKPIKCLSVSRDNEYIVSGSLDKMVGLWNMKSKSLVHVFEGHQNDITGVDITSDNDLVVSASIDSTIRIWNVKEKILDMTITCKYQVLNMLVWNNLIISGESLGAVKILKTSNRILIKQLEMESAVITLAASLKTNLLAIGCKNGSIILYDLERQTFGRTLIESQNMIVSISLNSSVLVAWNIDKMLFTWDLNTYELLRQESVEYACISTAITGTNQTFYSGLIPFFPTNSQAPNENKPKESYHMTKLRISIDKKYALFYCHASKEFHVWHFLEQKHFVLGIMELNCIEISEDSKIVVAGGEKLIYWKNFTNKEYLVGHSSSITCVDIAYDNELIVSGSLDKSIIIWYKFYSNSVISLNAVPDLIRITRSKQFIVYSVNGNCIRVHNISNNNPVSELMLDDQYSSLKILPNDKIISTDMLCREGYILSLTYTGKLEKYENKLAKESIQCLSEPNKFIE